jgi:DNA-directed RNA polymerase subunit N (RpoN/RPB10)
VLQIPELYVFTKNFDKFKKRVEEASEKNKTEIPNELVTDYYCGKDKTKMKYTTHAGEDFDETTCMLGDDCRN